MGSIFDDGGWVVALLLPAACAALATRWWYARQLAALRERLRRSEAQRQVEQDRARQTRVQIAQLTQLLADLQKRLQGLRGPQSRTPETAREALERAVPDRPADALAGPSHGFADTQPL